MWKSILMPIIYGMTTDVRHGCILNCIRICNYSEDPLYKLSKYVEIFNLSQLWTELLSFKKV